MRPPLTAPAAPRFRPAEEADLDAVLGMMRRFYAEDGYPFVEAEALRAAQELIGDPRLGRLWVAVDGGEVAGYLAVTLGFSLEHRGRDAFVDELYLEPGSRGRGLGREALAIAEAYCRERGVRTLLLEVEPHRDPAFELYRSSGFQDTGRRLMAKRLKPP